MSTTLSSVRSIITNPRHQVFFIDNFGVLKTADGPIKGTAQIMSESRRLGKTAVIVSNSANYSVQQLQQELAINGIDLPQKHIVTSGSLLAEYYSTRNLQGARSLVLGNDVTKEYVISAGGVVMDNREALRHHQDIQAVVIGWFAVPDKREFPDLPATLFSRLGLLDGRLLNAAFMALARGVPGVIANPDRTIPTQDGLIIGIAPYAEMLETLTGRTLTRLGKPTSSIFVEALRRSGAGTREGIVMVGDTIETDILGARNFGIRSLLVLSGNTSQADAEAAKIKPDFIAPSFALD